MTTKVIHPYINQPTTTGTDAYIVPASASVINFKALFHNISASAATIEMYIVPNGRSVDTTTRVFKRSIQSDETVTWDKISELVAGDKVHLKQATANAITVNLSGVEVI